MDKYKLLELKEQLANKLKVDDLRNWVNQNSAAVTVGAVVLLVISLAIIINQGRSPTPPPPGEAYYYDLVSKEYFTDEATKIAPIINPATGNEAVRAHFFTCGECSESERFVGYLEKYTPEAKQQLETNPESFEFYEEAFLGRLYAPAPSETADPAVAETWVDAETPPGFKIVEDLQGKCPPRKLKYCAPGR
ncbi:MAG: hypothetical protein GC159_12510 [Phycisphaera sp.]|nr:hypothetical protein [Phycisphaera sp.]